MSSASDRLTAYQAAELQILAGQSVRMQDGSQFAMPDLKLVQDMIVRLQRTVDYENRVAICADDIGPRVAKADFGNGTAVYDNDYGQLYTD